MRRIAAHIEGLAAAPFILLVGVVGGALQGIPRCFFGGPGGTAPHLAQFIVVGVTSVLWWTAALLLWWIAVHRRRWSLWATAGQLTLGLAFADALTNGLGMVVASITTNGAFAEAIVREPLTFASSNVSLTLIRSPLWFLGSAMAVALGRHLSGGEQAIAPSPSSATHHEAVT
jgi:hypothetical protein